MKVLQAPATNTGGVERQFWLFLARSDQDGRTAVEPRQLLGPVDGLADLQCGLGFPQRPDLLRPTIPDAPFASAVIHGDVNDLPGQPV